VKNAPKNRLQPAVVTGAVVMMLGISGCSFTAEQFTANPYAPSDGIVKDLGAVLLRNVLIVGNEDESEGRLIGTVFNTSDEPVDLTITAGGASTEITIEGQGEYRFEDETADDAGLAGIEDVPGSLIEVDFETEGETAVFEVPVLDGTLPEYREYVPGGYTPRPSEPAATEEAEGGAAGEGEAAGEGGH
jgi:hypothetical protein